MKKTMFIVLIMCSTVAYVTEAQPIVKRGYGYYQNDQRLRTVDLEYVMQSDAEAHQMLMAAKEHRTMGMLLGVASIPLFIVDASKMRNSEEFLPLPGTLSYAGVAALVIGGVFTSIGRSKVRKAVQKYNSNLKARSERPISLGISDKGIGIHVRF